MTFYWVFEISKDPPDIAQSSDKLSDFHQELYTPDVEHVFGGDWDCIQVTHLQHHTDFEYGSKQVKET